MTATIDTATLHGRLEELTGQYGVPGAAIAVFDGEEVVEAATGLANAATGVPVTTDTLFQIGSATKPYTASVVLHLVDQGRVELDTPIQRYLPGLTLPDPETAQAITVRRLLCHTSGLQGNNFTDFGRGEEATARYVDSLAQMGQLFEPGFTFSYSNSGYVLLGRLVEVLTERPFHAALRERLLEPAGLTRTVTLPEEAILHRTAVGHTPGQQDGQGPVVAPEWSLPPAMAPAGSMTCATARDLLSFARMHTEQGRGADGNQVLSPGSVREMQRPQVASPDKHGPAEAYGLGWFLHDWYGTRLVGHDGATASQCSFLRIDPSTGFAVALLVNQREGGFELYSQLFDEIFRQTLGLHMPSLPEPAAEPGRPDLSRYEGAYQQPEMTLHLQKTSETTLHATLTPEGPVAEMMPPMDQLCLKPVDDSVFLLYGMPAATRPTPVAFFDFTTAGHPNWLHFNAQAARRRKATD